MAPIETMVVTAAATAPDIIPGDLMVLNKAGDTNRLSSISYKNTSNKSSISIRDINNWVNK